MEPPARSWPAALAGASVPWMVLAAIHAAFTMLVDRRLSSELFGAAGEFGLGIVFSMGLASVFIPIGLRAIARNATPSAGLVLLAPVLPWAVGMAGAAHGAGAVRRVLVGMGAADLATVVAAGSAECLTAPILGRLFAGAGFAGIAVGALLLPRTLSAGRRHALAAAGWGLAVICFALADADRVLHESLDALAFADGSEHVALAEALTNALEARRVVTWMVAAGALAFAFGGAMRGSLRGEVGATTPVLVVALGLVLPIVDGVAWRLETRGMAAPLDALVPTLPASHAWVVLEPDEYGPSSAARFALSERGELRDRAAAPLQPEATARALDAYLDEVRAQRDAFDDGLPIEEEIEPYDHRGREDARRAASPSAACARGESVGLVPDARGSSGGVRALLRAAQTRDIDELELVGRRAPTTTREAGSGDAGLLLRIAEAKALAGVAVSVLRDCVRFRDGQLAYRGPLAGAPDASRPLPSGAVSGGVARPSVAPALPDAVKEMERRDLRSALNPERYVVVEVGADLPIEALVAWLVRYRSLEAPSFQVMLAP